MSSAASTAKRRGRFGLSVLLYGSSQCLVVLRDLLFVPLIARLLGQAAYGVWSQSMVTSMLLVPALRLRLELACVRFLAADSEQTTSETYLGLLLFIWIIILPMLVFLLFIPNHVSDALFGSRDFLSVARLLPVLLLTQVTFTFLLSFYRARSQIGRYAILRSASLFAETGAVIVCLLWIRASLPAALISLIAVQSLFGVGVGMRLLRKTRLAPLRWTTMKPFLLFSLPLIPNAVLLWVVNYGDRYVITHVMGLESVAIYSAAYRIAQLMTFIVMPIGFVLYPILSRLWDGNDPEEVRILHRKSQMYFLYLAIPLFAGLAKYGGEAIQYVGGVGFEASQALVMLLSAGIFFVGLYQLYVYVIHMSKKTWSLPAVFLVAAAGNIGLNLLAVPRWGLEGAAGATLIAYLILHIIVWWMSRQHLRVGFEWRALARAVLASAGMMLFLFPMRGGSIQAVLLAASVGAPVYFVLLYLLGGFGNCRDIWHDVWNRARRRGGQ